MFDNWADTEVLHLLLLKFSMLELFFWLSFFANLIFPFANQTAVVRRRRCGSGLGNKLDEDFVSANSIFKRSASDWPFRALFLILHAIKLGGK